MRRKAKQRLILLTLQSHKSHTAAVIFSIITY